MCSSSLQWGHSSEPVGKAMHSRRLPKWLPLSSLRGFDLGGHRAAAARDARVGAEGVDLVALQFGAFEARRADDDAPLRVDLPGHLVALLARVAEELLQH